MYMSHLTIRTTFIPLICIIDPHIHTYYLMRPYNISSIGEFSNFPISFYHLSTADGHIHLGAAWLMEIYLGLAALAS